MLNAEHAVVRMVLGQGLVLTGLGLLIGVGLTVGVTRRWPIS